MFDQKIVQQLAQRVHEAYVRDAATSGHASGSPEALVGWDQLDDHWKKQNVDQVEALITVLGKCGFEIVTVAQANGQEVSDFDADAIECLAREEHRRWMRLKRDQGYAYGESRSDKPGHLRHPDFQNWEDLQEAVREKDRNPMRRVPELVAEAGFAIVRR